MTSEAQLDPAASGGLKNHMFKNGTTLLLRQAVSIVLKFVGVLIVSRILGPDRYAAYLAAYGVYTFWLGVGQAGVGVYLLRQDGVVGTREIGTATTFLLVQSLTIVALVELGAGFLDNLTHIPGSVVATRIIILALPLQTLQVPALVRVERALNLRGVAVIELVTLACYYSLALPLALAGWGASALACGLIFQYAVAIVLTYRIARARVVFGWDWAVMRQIFGYMTSFSVANYVWQMRSLVNPFLVGPVLGATSVGIIGMAISVLEVLTLVRTMIWRITIVALARFQNDAAKLRRVISEGMDLQTLVIGTLLLGFGWFGPWVVPIVFGPRWLPLFAIYPFIALSYLTMSTFNMHTAVFSVLKMNWHLAAFQGVNVAILAAATVGLVRLLGMTGYGLAEMCTLASYALLHVSVARRIGSPDYTLAALWWGGAALGLFWRQLGAWTIIVPFLVLAVPFSLSRIMGYAHMVLNRRKGGEIPVPDPDLDSSGAL